MTRDPAKKSNRNLGVLLAATLFGLVVVLGTWRSPRLISTKNGRVAFRIYGFYLCFLLRAFVVGGRPGNLDQSSERMLESACKSIILSRNKSYLPPAHQRQNPPGVDSD